MRQLDVEIYEKRGHCPNCLTMRSEFDKWSSGSDDEVEVTIGFIEAHPEIVAESEALAAPIYKITDLNTEEVNFVSGLQPDVLVDTLDGKLDLWS